MFLKEFFEKVDFEKSLQLVKLPSMQRIIFNGNTGRLSHIDSQKATVLTSQGSHSLEKYLNLEGFLEKPLKNKSALKSIGKSLKSLEKSLNSTIFCRT